MNPSKMVRLLTKTDAVDAARVLGAAFLDDPLNVYLYPHPAQRAKRTPRFYGFTARLGIEAGVARGVGEPLASVALWSGPGSKSVGVGGVLRAGALRLALSPIAFVAFRVFGIFGQFERMHKQYAPEPDQFYLQVIGTRPEAQGKGYGAALLRALLNEADTARLPVYTETMTPRNVPMYQHFGFEVMEDYAVPKTDLHIWSFKRPPKNV